MTDASPVAALFDLLSSTYDTTGVAYFQPIADRLLAELGPEPGERWLDVGCGAGAVTLPAARAVGPEGTVVGVDLAPGMVRRCAAAAAAEGLGHLRAVVGDAAAPPVPGPFDAVSSSLVLFFLDDPAAALRAWAALLRPGGRLGVVTFGPQDAWWDDLDAVFRPYLPEAMLDARTSGQEGPFRSDAGMERLVAGAGYSDVRTVAWVLPVRFESAAAYLDWTMTTGQRAMWMRVPEERRPAVRAELTSMLDAHAGPDGSIALHQGVRITLAARP
ncbi:MAG: class I SAM-dependent methyltransferase [Candidatus Nanopelagicales bacterium]